MPATAIPASARGASSVAASISPRRSVASASSSTARGGSADEVALGVADDPGLQGAVPLGFAALADDHLGRAAADVEDQRRDLGRVLRGRPQISEPRLFVAAEHAGREREALPQLGDEGGPVLGVPHRAGGDRVDRFGAELLQCRDVRVDGRAGRLDRFRRQPPTKVDAAAQAGHGAAPLDRRHPAVRDVGNQQSRRVGADVDDGDSPRSVRHPATLFSRVPRRPRREGAPDFNATLLKSSDRRGVEQPGSSSGS